MEQLNFWPLGSYITFSFFSFKHSKVGRPFIIKIEAKPEAQFCAVTILQKFLALQGSRSGPLFCYPNGMPVIRSQFTAKLKVFLKAHKFGIHLYKAHSFRIGAATHALLSGKTETEIKILGRWLLSAFMQYIRVAGLPSFWGATEVRLALHESGLAARLHGSVCLRSQHEFDTSSCWQRRLASHCLGHWSWSPLSCSVVTRLFYYVYSLCLSRVYWVVLFKGLFKLYCALLSWVCWPL